MQDSQFARRAAVVAAPISVTPTRLRTFCANGLTAIRPGHYSTGMISEFSQLSQKIGQLAEQSASLRRENAELRQYAISLGAENAELHRRMQQAHERVAAVIARLPAEPAEHAANSLTEEHDAEASA